MATLRASLFVVGTGGEGTCASVAVALHRVPQYGGEDGGVPVQQLLFNCGECACRTLQEARIKLAGLSHVLLTRTSPPTVGGLPSLLFHLSDRGAGSVQLRGPPGLGGYHATIRPFVSRRFPEVSIVEEGGEAGGADSGGGGWVDVTNHAGWALLRRGAGAPGAASAGVRLRAIPLRGAPCHPSEEDAAGGAPAGPSTKRMRVAGGAALGGAAGVHSSNHAARREGAVWGVAYLVAVSGPFAPAPAPPGQAAASSDDEGSDSSSDGRGSLRSDGTGDGDTPSSPSSSSSSQASASSGASPGPAAGYGAAATTAAAAPVQRTVLVVDAAPPVASARVAVESVLEQLRAAVGGGVLGAVGTVVHLDTALRVEPTHGDSIDGGYVAAFEAAMPRAQHLVVSPAPRDARDGPGHFPAAAAQGARLGAVEPALWPLGALAAGGPARTPPVADVPLPARWRALPPRASMDIASGVVTPPGDDDSALRDAAAGALAAAAGTGAPPLALPPLPGHAAVADSNEISLEDDDDHHHDHGGGAGASGGCGAAPALAAAAAALAPPALMFLGTGAAAPSKLRSCSGLLLSWSGPPAAGGAAPITSRLLLDCGEGALGRLQSLAAAEGTPLPALLASIHGVAVSHMHADHHTGLLAVLAARAAACAPLGGAPPLLVMGPPALGAALAGYHRLLQPSSPAAPPYLFGGPQPAALAAHLAHRLPWVGGWERPGVVHCRDAVGEVLTLAHGGGGGGGQRLVLAYSGDTQPCAALVEAATRAAAVAAAGSGGAAVGVLLVHEATMNDDRAEDAAAKRHSTVGGALGVAAALRARLRQAATPHAPLYLTGTVLTHFSQRYPRTVCSGAAGGGASAAPPPAAAGAGAPETGPFLLAHDGLMLPLAPAALGAAMAAAGSVAARVEAAIGGGLRDGDGGDG